MPSIIITTVKVVWWVSKSYAIYKICTSVKDTAFVIYDSSKKIIK